MAIKCTSPEIKNKFKATLKQVKSLAKKASSLLAVTDIAQCRLQMKDAWGMVCDMDLDADTPKSQLECFVMMQIAMQLKCSGNTSESQQLIESNPTVATMIDEYIGSYNIKDMPHLNVSIEAKIEA